MKRLMLSILICLTVPVFAKGQSLPDSAAIQIRALMEGFCGRYHAPGIAVAVVHDREVVFSGAFGYANAEQKLPVTTATRFPIQSVTKIFTGTMLAQLYERGMVTLDDDARRYVPELELKNDSPSGPGFGGVNLLQLASHTSGLPRNSPADIGFAVDADRWMFGQEDYDSVCMSSKEEFLRSLRYVEREYPEYMLRPYGARYYSNLGYSVLGIALERAAGQDYKTYVLNEICRPLGMDNTGFIDEPGTHGLLPAEYKYDAAKGALRKAPRFVTASNLYAGGIYSTALDMAEFIRFQFSGEESSGNRVLSARSRAMMQSLNIAWKPSYPYVMHEGAMIGSKSMLVISTEHKIGWIILTNSGDFEFNRINEMLSQLLLSIYAKKEADDLNRFGSDNAGGYNVGYEFLYDNTCGKVVLNLSQLMWVKE